MLLQPVSSAGVETRQKIKMKKALLHSLGALNFEWKINLKYMPDV